MNRKTFCLIVVDRDRNVFSVHGPMLDDTELTEAVVQAQRNGRSINCHSVPAASRGEAASSYGASYPTYRQVQDALTL